MFFSTGSPAQKVFRDLTSFQRLITAFRFAFNKSVVQQLEKLKANITSAQYSDNKKKVDTISRNLNRILRETQRLINLWRCRINERNFNQQFRRVEVKQKNLVGKLQFLKKSCGKRK